MPTGLSRAFISRSLCRLLEQAQNLDEGLYSVRMGKDGQSEMIQFQFNLLSTNKTFCFRKQQQKPD